MIITRKVARWALLLKREALGRTYGAQKRSEQAPRGATTMLPRSGRVDDNIDTDTDTVATDLTRTSSCVPLALPLPCPCYYRYCPRATVTLLSSDHEDDSPLPIAGIDDTQAAPTAPTPAASTANIAEQQDAVHGEQELEYAPRGTEEEVVNRVNYRAAKS
ncbi:uncharacterized protein LOC128885534 [Hylaeus anthracinus]|uniref:uncharacterized protein LOC128875023 n=1 Tax=Hylaeus volcanicus TaxID=313075 RepID=UPI0023B7CF54|nr:uncharacterized protein LOC128875023 [Hylaeus volcanicus]XP_053995601.1 uncharacterized protein LOC128885534 [Hylaeus anthracinus]